MDNRKKTKNNIIKISISDGYCTEDIHIEKVFFNNNELNKIIKFSIWDDMSFSSYIVDEELYSDRIEIDYEIEIDDLIYFALNRLLGKDNILIVDDDGTREEFKNYMEIKRENNKIIITFHDEDINKPIFERFSVFIKNIGPDARSKIKDINIKYRLISFFKEAREILTEEFHQYSFDECYEILKQKGNNPFLINNILFKNSTESCLNSLTQCSNEDNTIENWCNNYTSEKEQYNTEVIKLKKLERRNVDKQ